MPSTCMLEVLCKPSEQLLLFIREQMGLPVDEDAIEELHRESEALVGEQRG